MLKSIPGFLLVLCVFIAGCDTKVKNVSSCGDGFIDPGEGCDGDALPADSCEDLGYYTHTGPLVCRADCTLDEAACEGRCGDGTIQTIHGEDCEESDLGGKSCLLLGLGAGELACGATCRFDTSGCETPAVCGDGTITAPVEQCEGADLAGATCESLGYYGGTLGCHTDCKYDLSACRTFGRCGDGEIQTAYGEQCEGADLAGATCRILGYHGGVLLCDEACRFDLAACEAEGQCGDGEIQAGYGEVCDGENLDGDTCLTLGYHGGDLACAPNCRLLDEASCEAEGRCGDGEIQDAYLEVCDGENLDGQTCQTLGYHGGTLACAQDCLALEPASCEAEGRCGDGIVQTTYETCDGTDFQGETCRLQGFFTGELVCDAACARSLDGCRTAIGLSAGTNHACVVLDDGTVRCWGSNAQGQLGDGTTWNRDYPVPVAGLTGVVEVAGGSRHTCARRTDGTVWCWGLNTSGQLGDGTTTPTTVPVQVSGLAGALSLSAGDSHTCAVTGLGTVWCWGSNTFGQLGLEGMTSSPVPVQPTGLPYAVSVTAGDNHTCAQASLSRNIWCWGRNHAGQVGDHTLVDRFLPVEVLSSAGTTPVVAGEMHTCVLYIDGEVLCWGGNDSGQLGDGTTVNRPGAVTAILSGAETLTAGSRHTCATVGGQARCWGRNTGGQLGDGTTTGRTTAVPVPGLTDLVSLAAGWSFTCSLHTDGFVRCWGYSDAGQLGQGSLSPVPAATPVPGLAGLRALTAGRDFTCGIDAGDQATCWGTGAMGQLGNQTTQGSYLPAVISDLFGIHEIAAGQHHACGRGDDGILHCWGYNEYGQLGDGTTTLRTSPVEAVPENVWNVDAGFNHTCAAMYDGTVACWGQNNFGQLGDGTTSTRTTPAPVTGLSGVVQVSAGYLHSCARHADGSVSCWGNNDSGRLGDGTTTNRLTPVAVTGLSAVHDLSAGTNHTCAALDDGSVACWGYNNNGQLGDGTTTRRLSPTPVPGISTATLVRASNQFSCALLGDGNVLCWGANQGGQLGLGDLVGFRTSPQPVTGLSGVTALALGEMHACALLAGGAVSCWGSNAMGALGQYYVERSLMPILVVP